MKKLLLLCLFVLFAGLSSVKGALSVTDITAPDWDDFIAQYEAAWSAVYRGGSTGSGLNIEEVRLARNIATPESGIGGTNTIIGNLTWSSTNNELEILIDGAGNISARANALTIGDLPITRPFNQILIRVFDKADFDSNMFRSLGINGSDIPDMYADGAGPNEDNDIVSVTGFGSQAPFSLNGIWDPGSNPADNDQYIWIVALENVLLPPGGPGPIPEVSTTLLIGCSSLLLLRRRR